MLASRHPLAAACAERQETERGAPAGFAARLPCSDLAEALCRAGGGSSSLTALDAAGNTVTQTSWLAKHQIGDHSLVQGLKVRTALSLHSVPFDVSCGSRVAGVDRRRVICITTCRTAKHAKAHPYELVWASSVGTCAQRYACRWQCSAPLNNFTASEVVEGIVSEHSCIAWSIKSRCSVPPFVREPLFGLGRDRRSSDKGGGGYRDRPVSHISAAASTAAQPPGRHYILAAARAHSLGACQLLNQPISQPN